MACESLCECYSLKRGTVVNNEKKLTMERQLRDQWYPGYVINDILHAGPVRGGVSGVTYPGPQGIIGASQ